MKSAATCAQWPKSMTIREWIQRRAAEGPTNMRDYAYALSRGWNTPPPGVRRKWKHTK